MGAEDSLLYKNIAVRKAHKSSYAFQNAQIKEGAMGFKVCLQNGWSPKKVGFLS